MSPNSIDQRIVDMQFNNRQFESGIKDSLNSIEQLKKGLDFRGADQGLNNLNAAAQKFSLSGISDGLDIITQKFSALSIMGTTTLINLTNRAVNMAVRLGKSLSIDQLTAGWSKYEQKTESVQTLMNSTGRSLEDINGYLDRLMWFSDETSYGFTDMTAALAQMTSTGGDIDKLIPLITGVANATAYAGKGASQFSRAMYNLNQSYGSGNLQYMDWRSLELAGVASKELKQIFIDTGIALGRIKKDQVTIGNFGTTLKDKWANTEVMEIAFGKFSEMSEEAYRRVQAGEFDTAAQAIKALTGQYSELAEKAFKSAQTAKTFKEAIEATKDAVSSGWLTTYEIIFGDYEEASKLWTNVANNLWEVFAAGAEARNDLLSAWKELGGRDDLIAAFDNIYEAIQAIITPIKEAFRAIFPPTTGERLAEFTKTFREFTEKLKIGDEAAEKIRDTFKGLFSVLSILKEGFLIVIRAIRSLIVFVKPAISWILEITSAIGRWVTGTNDAIKKSEAFTNAFERVKDILAKVADSIKESFSKIVKAFERFTGIDLSGLDAFVTSVKERFKPFEVLGNVIRRVVDFIKSIFSKLGPFLSKVGKTIGESFRTMNFAGLLQLFTTGAFASVLLGLKNLFGSFKGIADSASGTLDGIKKILDGVRNCLKAYENDLKAKTLLKIAIAIAILTASLVVLSGIDATKLTSALMAITVLFTELFGSMSIFSKVVGGKEFKAMTKVTKALILLSVAVLILSKAVAVLANTDWGGLSRGLLGVGLLIAMLVGVTKIFTPVSKGLFKAGVGLVIFALAVKLLVSSVSVLSKIEPQKLVTGMAALLGVIAMMIGFMLSSKFSGLKASDAFGLILVAIAVRILASAVKAFNTIKPEAITAGLLSIGVLLTELALFTRMVGTGKGLMATGAGMILLSIAMLIFAKVIEKIGKLDPDVLFFGLLGLGIALTIITTAIRAMPKNLLGVGAGMILLSVGLLIIAGALKVMGSMSWDELARSLIALGGALLILSFAVKSMNGAIAGAFAIFVVSGALIGLAIAMKILSTISIGGILKSLIALGGVLGVIGLATSLLAPFIPAMFALGAALIVLGLGLSLVGASTIILGIGLSTLASAGLGGIGVLIALAAALIPLSVLAPVMFVVGGALLVLSVGIFAVGASLAVMAGGLGLLVALGPAASERLLELTNTATQVAQFGLKLLLAGAGLLLFGVGALLAGVGAIAAGLGLVILAAGLKELEKVDTTSIGDLSRIAGDLLKASVKLILASPGLLVGGAALLVFGQGALSTGEGLKAINEGLDDVVKAVKKVPNDIKSTISTIIEEMKNLIEKVVTGMKAQEPEVAKAASELVRAAIKAIDQQKTSFYISGVNAVNGFIAGMNSRLRTIQDTASTMAQTALNATNRVLQIKSPSRAFGESARYSIMGFVRDFKKYTPLAVAAAAEMSQQALTPVMSMSDHILGAQKIGSGLQRMTKDALASTPTIISEKNSTVRHTFDVLRVEGVNNEGEFIAAAEYSVEEMLTSLMRRQSRV